MRLAVCLSLLLLMALAGCVDETAEPVEGPEGPGSEPSLSGAAPRPGPKSDDGVAPAPDWRPGDWWKWQVTPRDAPAYEATTVVVSVSADTFLIGWGAVDEGLRSQFFHFVPAGELGKDLTWAAHHEQVDWFDFPLEHGKTWTGSVWMGDLALEAQAADIEGPAGTVPGFRVSGAHAERDVRVEYDWATELQIFTTLRFYLNGEVPWLELTLLEHGTDRAEPVHLLSGDMHFATFTSLEHAVHTSTPPPTVQQVMIPEGVTHVSMGCYLGGAPGYYGFRLTDSADTTHDCEAHTSDDWFGMLLAYGSVTPGDAMSVFATAGQGSVFTELFFLTAEEVVPG